MYVFYHNQYVGIKKAPSIGAMFTHMYFKNKKARTSFEEMRMSLHLQVAQVLKPVLLLNEVRRAKRDAT